MFANRVYIFHTIELVSINKSSSKTKISCTKIIKVCGRRMIDLQTTFLKVKDKTFGEISLVYLMRPFNISLNFFKHRYF